MPLGSWLSPEQISEVQQLALQITTTGDDSPIFETASSQSYPLIGLNGVQANPAFSPYNGTGYSIAILDTGADLDHSAFGPDNNSDGVSDRIVYQYDFSGANDSNASDLSQSGHGTHVAGIAAGMATGADLIILKVFPDGNGGASSQDVEEALRWVVLNHAQYNIVRSSFKTFS